MQEEGNAILSDSSCTTAARDSPGQSTLNPTVLLSTTASRTSQVISVALQRAVAFNALDYRYTKLAKGRVVGGGTGSAVQAVQMLAVAVGDWEEDVDSVRE